MFEARPPWPRPCQRVPRLPTTTEKLDRARVSLEIEVEPERVERHKERAVARLSKQVRIPGFRPGKVPRQTLERHVGPAMLLQEALEELIPEVYQEAILAEAIEAIDQPQFSLKSTDPLVVTAIVPVRPVVSLNDYQSLRAPKPPVMISDEQVADTILGIRRRYAVLEPVDRAIEWDDTVRADVTVSVDGQAEPHVEEDAEFPVRHESVVSLPGFVEHLVGLERGGPYHIEFALPADFSATELAGKQAAYDVTINEVKREILPELDDEFVASLDETGVATAADLEARVRADLQTQGERLIASDYQNEIVDLLVATSTLDYPEVLVDREIDRVIDRESNHASHTREGLLKWLEAIGQTEDGFRDAARDTADLSVRRALVLSHLIDAEHIEITDEQVDAEIDSLVAQMTGGRDENTAVIRGLFDTEEGRVSIRNQLVSRAALERLEAICVQAEEGDAAAPRASRRRRGAAATAEDGDRAEESTEGGDMPDAEALDTPPPGTQE